jgi:hypothetical protein
MTDTLTEDRLARLASARLDAVNKLLAAREEITDIDREIDAITGPAPHIIATTGPEMGLPRHSAQVA